MPGTRRSGRRHQHRRFRRGADGRGFTLVETLIAILLLTIVMAALAPAFYGTLRAGNVTNQRSTANSVAVAAAEQIRSYPYFEIGYYPSDQPPACSSASTLPEVNLDSGQVAVEPLAHLATATSVNRVQFTIQRCVYWVNSTISTDTAAYKEAVVTVYWAANGTTANLSITSSIFPGGVSGYTAENDYIPGSAASASCTSSTSPGVPGNVTAVDDSTAPTNTIDVSWTASNPAPDYYVVLYESQGDPGEAPIDQSIAAYTVSPETTATYMQITVGSATQYWVQVQAVSCGNPSTESLTATATTAGSSSSTTSSSSSSSTTSTTTGSGSSSTSSSTSTTTSSTTTSSTTIPPCSLNTLSSVPPHTVTVAIKNGAMYDYSSNSFTLTVNASGSCSNIYVAYAPSGCTPAASGCTTDWAAMTGTGGTLSGSAALIGNQSWSDQATLQFVVYVGSGTSAVQYTTPSVVTENVTTCKYSPSHNSTCT